MNFEPAEKMKNFEAGIFQILDEKKKELQKQGKKIYNFSVGTPDFETPECVMKAVSEACLHPENYHYSLGETDELLDALAARYKYRGSALFGSVYFARGKSEVKLFFFPVMVYCLYIIIFIE